jgi:hypothetical protein
MRSIMPDNVCEIVTTLMRHVIGLILAWEFLVCNYLEPEEKKKSSVLMEESWRTFSQSRLCQNMRRRRTFSEGIA